MAAHLKLIPLILHRSIFKALWGKSELSFLSLCSGKKGGGRKGRRDTQADSTSHVHAHFHLTEKHNLLNCTFLPASPTKTLTSKCWGDIRAYHLGNCPCLSRNVPFFKTQWPGPHLQFLLLMSHAVSQPQYKILQITSHKCSFLFVCSTRIDAACLCFSSLQCPVVITTCT